MLPLCTPGLQEHHRPALNIAQRATPSAAPTAESPTAPERRPHQPKEGKTLSSASSSEHKPKLSPIMRKMPAYLRALLFSASFPHIAPSTQNLLDLPAIPRTHSPPRATLSVWATPGGLEPPESAGKAGLGSVCWGAQL